MRRARDDRLAARLVREDRGRVEAARLAALVTTLLDRPDPPRPAGRYPLYAPLRAALADAVRDGDGEAIEEAFLALYCHLHGHAAAYSPQERRAMDGAGGYWAHAGGLSPILKAPEWIAPGTVSADLGAGNGLQLLFVQLLAPHATSVQVEISHDMIEAGRRLQEWLGIAGARVRWRCVDLMQADLDGFDFVYLYRPVRPEGPGRQFYVRLGAALASRRGPVTVFSVADCLAPFLPDGFERVYFDGHLSCFHRDDGSDAGPLDTPKAQD